MCTAWYKHPIRQMIATSFPALSSCFILCFLCAFREALRVKQMKVLHITNIHFSEKNSAPIKRVSSNEVTERQDTPKKIGNNPRIYMTNISSTIFGTVFSEIK